MLVLHRADAGARASTSRCSPTARAPRSDRVRSTPAQQGGFAETTPRPGASSAPVRIGRYTGYDTGRGRPGRGLHRLLQPDGYVNGPVRLDADDARRHGPLDSRRRFEAGRQFFAEWTDRGR